ncbi:MAG: thioredoxin domain-containing protein [Tepidiformaceae bacterium]
MAEANPAHRNRLAHETSPYLLQHADNPVDWYPWGEEAFAKARAEDKPVLLSVGYSACHWCHVMAHESFEDEETAALMNRWFVNVKVDREERPDVDGVYMTAVQALTGQGGWPMTVFMTADGRPFYAGTYFPPQDGHGRPGFPRLLESLHNAWEGDREKVLTSADGITEHLQRTVPRDTRAAADVSADMTEQGVQAFRDAFDATWGGFGGAPKFPSPGNLEFLLAYHARTGGGAPGRPGALEMVLTTLRKMAEGGMYDHLGGGFARYSVDERWLVPHFEKMLYDNAQLARVYLHAWQLTQDPFYERIVRETLHYLLREMLDGEGGFHSAQDADSEGIEGKYFVWTVEEVREALGEEAPLFLEWFDVTGRGNFQDPHHPEFVGRNVLSTPLPVGEVAAKFGLAPQLFAEKIDELRQRMLAVREQRVRPGLDDKVLTSWNGLALGAFAEAARVFGDAEYRAVAEANAAFVREKLWRDGTLLHTYKGGSARIAGMLEDYTYYGLGLVELYRLTGDLAHLEWARELLEVVVGRFHDEEGGGLYETAEGGEQLLLRQKPLFDSATPSGNGAAALVAFWVGRYYARPDHEALAPEVLGQVQRHLLQAPTGFGSGWQVAELLLAPRLELAIVGAPGAREPFERVAAERYMPSLVLAPAAEGRGLPVLEGRAAGEGGAAAYLCRDMVCDLPVTEAGGLAAQLDAVTAGSPFPYVIGGWKGGRLVRSPQGSFEVREALDPPPDAEP